MFKKDWSGNQHVSEGLRTKFVIVILYFVIHI